MNVVQLTPRVTLGGSTAAAACGIDPYRSRVELWAQLTGRLPTPETEAMQWGRRLEPLIRDAVAEHGYAVTHDPAWTAADPERPWLVGHPDGIAEDPHGTLLLETKTASQWAHAAAGDVPLAYNAQAQVYLHLSGLSRALLACLVAGQRLELHEIPRDPQAIALLLDLMADFLGYVQRDEPPPPDGSQSARETVAALNPEHVPGKVVRLLGDDWQAYRQLVARREQRDRVDEQVRELETRLKLTMGDAETALSPSDVPVLHWRSVVSRRIDARALREQRPHIAELFETETTTRRFTLA